MRPTFVLGCLLCYSVTVLAAFIGIDYGYQHLKAMVVSPSAPMELLLTPEAKRKDLSGLAIKKLPGKSGEVERFYGAGIGSLATRFPQNTLCKVKSLLGKSSDNEHDVTLFLKHQPGVNVTFSERNSVLFSVDDVEYPVEEILAMNLNEIIERGDELLKEKDEKNVDRISQVAISVPEYFNQYQRGNLLDSMLIGNYNIDTLLVSDSVAVAIDFAIKQRSFEAGKKLYYAIYDMGSGSTQASLYSFYQPENDTLPIQIEFGGYGYASAFGGSSLTQAVAELIENQFLEKHSKVRSEQLHSDHRAMAKINAAAEKAKLVLSANNEVSVNIESIFEDYDFHGVILKSHFEEYIQDFTERVNQPLEDMIEGQLWNETISIKDINGLVLVGGGIRVPSVQAELSKFLGEDKFLKNVNADESVVNGVAVRGVKLFKTFKTKPIEIVDRSIYSYEVKMEDDENLYTIFEKGTTFPAVKSVIMKTSDDLERSNLLDIYENEHIFRSFNITDDYVKSKFKNGTCEYGYAYNVTFTLSQNRIFGIDNAKAVCLKSPLLSAETGEDYEDEIKMVDSALLSNNKTNTAASMYLSSYGTIVKDFSYRELLGLRKHISLLDKQQKDRLQMQSLFNSLESALYNARNYLSDIEDEENLPTAQISQLNEIIPEYLEWLDEEGDSANKLEFSDRLTLVKTSVEKIKLFMKNSKNDISVEAFQVLMNDTDNLFKKVESKRNQFFEELEDYELPFERIGLNLTKALKKVKPSRILESKLTSWNETMVELLKITKNMTETIENNQFDSFDQEYLFELKLTVESLYAEANAMFPFFSRSYDYKLSELDGVYQKAVRTQKRKEEKLKKQSLAKNGTTTDEDDHESENATLTSSAATSDLTDLFETADSTDATSSNESTKSTKQPKKTKEPKQKKQKKSQKQAKIAKPSKSKASKNSNSKHSPTQKRSNSKSTSKSILHDEL